jgi:hypothetical protein
MLKNSAAFLVVSVDICQKLRVVSSLQLFIFVNAARIADDSKN